MEECESLDSEMTELQSEASEAISQDDEDEVEELQNSLREVTKDHSVKPNIQCLMVDPSFSMVTVQSEDSGIVWETASSRCSTPWASETSSISEGYSMEGSGAAGKITIVFDEEKVIRRRTRSGGRSRLGDRLSRPGSSRSASALGVERLEMMEVSLPNVKQEKTQTEPDLEEIKSKDQQLFSLISEGYEILNIRVPSKLPTVDEEESTELQDNLSYLDQTPKIKSRNHHEWTQQNHVLPAEEELLDDQEVFIDLSGIHDAKESTGDIDYFEKFTLVDIAAPAEQVPELQEEAEQPAAKPQVEEQQPAKETAADSPSASEESFVFVTDVDIVGEHLDEVFYGEGAPDDAMQRREEEEAEARVRMRRESQRSGKQNGSVLFGSEETILTPIFISPGPPKIIDQILLDEPTAMSFMYSDLYEDAVGERKRSDEEHSEAESVASEKTYRRRLSDSEEADGYLEKFTLKDEIPAVEVPAESEEEEREREGRRMWSQSKFEMTGCLTRVVKEEDKDKTKLEEEKTPEVRVEKGRKDLLTAAFEEKQEIVTETENEREEVLLSPVTEEPADREKESIQESKLIEDQMEDREVKGQVKGDLTDPPESSTDEPHPEAQQVDSKVKKSEKGEEHQREAPAEMVFETEEPCESQKVAEKTAQVVESAAEETTPVGSKAPHIITERSLSEEAVTDTTMLAVVEKVLAEVKAAEVKEPETERQEVSTSEIETSAGTTLREEKEAAEVVPEDVAPVEVITDCDASVHALVEVTEKALDEKEIQTQVQIDLQEVTSVERTDVPTAKEEEEHGVLTEEPAVESQLHGFITEADQESEVKAEISTEVTVMPKEVETDSEKKQHEILEPKQLQQEESVTDSELITEDKTPTEDAGAVAQEMVKAGDELILLVPKGQAVEMDIEISQSLEKTTSETVALSEADGTCEHLIAPEITTSCLETLQAPTEETTTEEQDVKPDVVLKEEALPREELDITPLAPVEDVNTEEQRMDLDFEEDEGVFSPLRSFTPQEDLSGLHREDTEAEAADVEQKAEIHGVEDAPETSIVLEDFSPQVDLQKEDLAQKAEIHRVEEAPETSISKEDSIPEVELHSEDVEQKAEIHKVEEAPETSIVEEDLSPEVALQKDDLEQKVDMHIVEDAPETIIVKGDSIPEVALHSEDVEQKVEISKVEEAPETSIVEEDLIPEVALQKEDLEQKVDMHIVEDAPETSIVKGDSIPEVALQREDVEQTMEQEEAAAEALEVIAEELQYEVISKQDAKEMPEPETQKTTEEPKPESAQEEREERMEMAMALKKEEETEKEEKFFGLSPEEELIEDDYEIIDAEEESQARLAAELQGMDWFCLSCGCLMSEEDCVSGEHHEHEVTAVDQAYEEIKEKLSDWISDLQARSENIEDLVSELELAYNSVEDQCVESEAAMQAQNEEMMAQVMEQYNNMSISMEEEKKAKLEQLYDQIVSFQESIDSAKGTLETTAREADTEARSPEDIQASLKAALDSAMSLELGPKGLLVFEDYAKGNTSSSHLAQRKGIPVPQRPTLQLQEPGSATSTSVTVYWKVNPGDIIDCFQVYCMEDPHGAVSEEYRVTVKESYCVLEELEPDKTYKVWVMAVNYTGCSLPSERLAFRTAPSVPVIDTERCTVMWDSATLRWSSANQTPEQSFTLEYCRQYELEGEGLRSISGIKSCEQKVLLQPNENYLFYIKAVNESGASEQSEAALISTKGTRFRLLKASAHPALDLSVDQTTLHYSQDAHENTESPDKQCPSILGELLPAQGLYYWETLVSGSTAYRLGVACSTANMNSPLGENSLSWCLQSIPSPSGCRYQLLHNDVQSTVFVIAMPERVGTLLDYQLGRLSFYNADSGQLLGTFCHRFTQPCHPALALEMPGSLEVSMVPEVPEFTKDS
ncbi:cardiomyopathy-associated protein 5 [Centropristis striata]|uniref:cardiomyopathy-associated protein 5 n=1 Tax=Centropristis striata TaxID=184440 RepID=UPI0027DFD3CE|nr:cardiomyopathy-associated protein 5 [Centropristis striata]